MSLFTYTPKSLIPGSALTAAAVTYYTAPSAVNSVCSIVKEMIICNTDTVARTITVYAIPPAGALAIANTILNQVTLQPNETKLLPMSKVLPPGAFIQALASQPAVVSITCSGLEVTT